MLLAKDFRRYAREALKGRWMKAGLVALVAGLLGASIEVSNIGNVNFDVANVTVNSGVTVNPGAAETVYATGTVPASLFAIVMGIGLIGLLWYVAVLIVGGATTLGYAKYNLNLVDDKDPQFSDLFSQYHRLGTGFGLQFFRALFVFLWTLLFIIPGIIAQYRYSMAAFILAENPGMTAREAITESKKLMVGNKWRKFCLEFSFVGWILLSAFFIWIAIMFSVLPMIVTDSTSAVTASMIAMTIVVVISAILIELFLAPYITASSAAFYREIKDGKYSDPQIEVTAEEQEYTDESFTVTGEEGIDANPLDVQSL